MMVERERIGEMARSELDQILEAASWETEGLLLTISAGEAWYGPSWFEAAELLMKRLDRLRIRSDFGYRERAVRLSHVEEDCDQVQLVLCRQSYSLAELEQIVRNAQKVIRITVLGWS